ncbi:MAG: hypothetical protein ACK4S4_08360 [Pyrinomonadaceae bacterium]
MRIRSLTLFVLLLCCLAASGCGVVDQAVSGVSSIVGLNDTAVVIAKTAQIRTSYAVVAADLLEVKRNDQLDILDQVEFEKVLWYRVRAHDEAKTEGWIEAQNVITSDVLDKSKKLAEEFANVPAQSAGQLRAASNLRLAPEMKPENVLFKLAGGSSFEIMGWQYVPKQEAGDDVDSNSAGRSRRSRSEEIDAAREENEPEKLDDKYDIWYKVRLDRSVSPAPAGWLFGRQVELQIPSDIVYFQSNNRKFIAWQRLDAENAEKGAVGRATTPGNWVVLSRTNAVKAIDGVEPDFDGIVVLAFDKYDQSYYTAWRSSGDVWGQLPMRIEGTGDSKSVILRLRGPDGQIVEKRFSIFKDKSRVRVTPPEDIAQFQTRSK